MENVVSVIFDVESEAYKAFSELRAMPFGEGYAVGEAALLKREGDAITVIDAYDAAAVTADDTAVDRFCSGCLQGREHLLHGNGTPGLEKCAGFICKRDRYCGAGPGRGACV